MNHRSTRSRSDRGTADTLALADERSGLPSTASADTDRRRWRHPADDRDGRDDMAADDAPDVDLSDLPLPQV